MKPNLKILAVILLVVIFSASCASLDGPEAAARINFLDWAGNIRTPYRHENFETLNNDGALATVRITVDLIIKGEWEEKQIEIQCEKVDNDWQCDRSMQFK
jgi:hypothetical protein